MFVSILRQLLLLRHTTTTTTTTTVCINTALHRFSSANFNGRVLGLFSEWAQIACGFYHKDTALLGFQHRRVAI